MRVLAAAALALLGACAPDIVSGAYLCGAESSCPDGQACDGIDDVCVLAPSAEPFACEDNDTEPNNSAASAETIQTTMCVSPPTEITGCTPTNDDTDFFAFDVPAVCGPTAATVRIRFPIAYEQLALTFDGAEGSTTGTADACDANGRPDEGTAQLCVKANVTAGGHYTIHIARTGAGNCGGACGFNRYHLALQLGSP